MDNFKPLYDLWLVADQFRRLFVGWFEDPLEKLDAGLMDNQMEEWMIEMKRLKKFAILTENKS